MLKKTLGSIFTVALLVSLAISATAFAGTGNGAPSGTHYNLNLIGLNKGGSMSESSNGGVIFVPLWGKCIIDLRSGSDYKVLVNNCVSGSHAQFQLPPPSPGYVTTQSSFTLAYSVWMRSLSPKGSSQMTTCYTDNLGATYCNTGSLVVISSKQISQGKFSDVSKELLTVCVGGKLQPIFGNALYNYFWTYDNYGNHLAQLRFYPISTQVISSSTSCSSVSTTT